MKWLKGLSLICMYIATIPLPLYGYRTPVEDDYVKISPIIEYYEGIDEIKRDDDGNYYREYVFNGNIIHMYGTSSVLRLNGDTVPYDIGNVDGIYVPRPNTDVRLMDDEIKLSSRFLTYYFDYEMNGEYLVYGEEPVSEEPTAPGLVVEESPNDPAVPEVPVKEEIPEPVMTEEPEIVDVPTVDEPNTPEEDPVDVPTEPEEEIVREPIQLGLIEHEIDLIIAEEHQTKDNPISVFINEEEFHLVFEGDSYIRATQVSTNKTIGTEVFEGLSRHIPFRQDNEDYYTVTLNFVDTRVDTSEELEETLQSIDLDIDVSHENNLSIVKYSSDDPEILTRTLDIVEAALDDYVYTVTKKEDHWTIQIVN